jgi:hypothetical protein
VVWLRARCRFLIQFVELEGIHGAKHIMTVKRRICWFCQMNGGDRVCYLGHFCFRRHLGSYDWCSGSFLLMEGFIWNRERKNFVGISFHWRRLRLLCHRLAGFGFLLCRPGNFNILPGLLVLNLSLNGPRLLLLSRVRTKQISIK